MDCVEVSRRVSAWECMEVRVCMKSVEERMHGLRGGACAYEERGGACAWECMEVCVRMKSVGVRVRMKSVDVLGV